MDKNSEKYKIRPLLKKDQKTISKMFLDMADQIDDQSIKAIITNASTNGTGKKSISEEERRANIIRVFMNLFARLSAHLYDEVSNFLADLINVNPEDYDQLPIDIDVRILEQVMEAPEVENFFIGVSRLFKTAPWYNKALTTLKDKFDSVKDSATKNSAN